MAENRYREYVPGKQGTGSSAGAGSGAGAQDIPAGTRERSDPYQAKPGRDKDRKHPADDAPAAQDTKR